MKKITDFELQSILGGWANPEECKKVQELAILFEIVGDVPDEDWAMWGEAFDTFCLGI